MIGTDPDVVRRNMNTPRSFKEAHGCFCDFDDEDTARSFPPDWLWLVVAVAGVAVLVATSVWSS